MLNVRWLQIKGIELRVRLDFNLKERYFLLKFELLCWCIQCVHFMIVDNIKLYKSYALGCIRESTFEWPHVNFNRSAGHTLRPVYTASFEHACFNMHVKTCCVNTVKSRLWKHVCLTLGIEHVLFDKSRHGKLTNQN